MFIDFLVVFVVLAINPVSNSTTTNYDKKYDKNKLLNIDEHSTTTRTTNIYVFRKYRIRKKKKSIREFLLWIVFCLFNSVDFDGVNFLQVVRKSRSLS